ncbi:hypothetical protein [Caballeronia ptereochthonis]|uniref:Lipoprotein n=1 Tax=Caballeronia ptereochthonis TaxID=1777144 RepID=A0A158DKL3_9BURK|nr:hypothetical protein [Caballeronia ptereochthonis]SAK95124.1 hypothetical protein AWB83_05566 [Caballeronia ptereochthonis]
MISVRSSLGPCTAAIALAAGLLLGGCYYPYGYPAYPSYPVVGTTYTQQEFTLPAQAASGTAAAAPAATLPPEYQYAVGPYADYYQTYPYPYPYYPPYAAYPAYYGYGYGYPAISFGFGYWGGGGCCWGHGWHGGGWHGNGWHGGGWHGGGGGWHGGGGGWHGGGSSWQGGGGWHGGGGGGHGH